MRIFRACFTGLVTLAASPLAPPDPLPEVLAALISSFHFHLCHSHPRSPWVRAPLLSNSSLPAQGKSLIPPVEGILAGQYWVKSWQP